MEQESWIRQDDGSVRVIDLHWGLRNHPVLRGVLSFEEQWEESIELPGLAPGVRAQSVGHALLNACMHWFDDLYAHSHPLGWLLDKDLLWRCLDESTREALVRLAIERELAGLLAESLRITRRVFDTPVSEALLENLAEAGRGQRATRLVLASRHPLSAHWFALQCEPSHAARLRRFRLTLFPPAAHLRERFPEGSRLGLAGLYLRRWVRRARKD